MYASQSNDLGQQIKSCTVLLQVSLLDLDDDKLSVKSGKSEQSLRSARLTGAPLEFIYDHTYDGLYI